MYLISTRLKIDQFTQLNMFKNIHKEDIEYQFRNRKILISVTF